MGKNFEFMLCSAEEFSTDELRQGDVLQRNDALKERIAIAHGYYAEAPGYDYFIVLTPSCELALRDGRCSSRYISIAAVRPASLLVERQLDNYKQSVKAPGLFCSSGKRQLAEQYVMRLLHNAEDGYLYLPGELFGQNEADRIAFLKLSIVLRVDHYQACLQAKVLQLADSFSAKVGSLTAGLYGQVATAAIEEQSDVNHEEVIAGIKEAMLDREHTYWLSAQGMKAFKKLLAALKKQKFDEPLTPEDTRSLVQQVPTDQSLLSERIVDILKGAGLISQDAEIYRNLIASDSVVVQFLRVR